MLCAAQKMASTAVFIFHLNVTVEEEIQRLQRLCQFISSIIEKVVLVVAAIIGVFNNKSIQKSVRLSVCSFVHLKHPTVIITTSVRISTTTTQNCMASICTHLITSVDKIKNRQRLPLRRKSSHYIYDTSINATT